MEIKILRLRGIKCKECGCEINKGEQYNKIDGGRYHLYCARIKRLHTGVVKWIKSQII
jgi:hypothetical protein